MKDRKIKITLCDLANDLNGIDNKSIPIGVGFVASYCKKIHGSSVDVSVHRTFKSFWEDVQKSPPDIAGFGSYDWNYNLTIASIKKLKKEGNPNCLVVLGGANAEIDPNDNLKFLKDNPCVDYVVYGDGEKPFSNIVKNYIENPDIDTIKAVPIDGCRALVEDKIVSGKSSDVVMSLDEIPSPYLTGIFDELLKNETLMPIIQNIRGCPYRCRYCVSGTQFGKIRHFSLDRIKEEIEYLRENAKNRFLRFSDDNFGIVKHDLDVAKHVRNHFDEHQYPAGLKVYSAKKQNDRVREVGLILKPLMTYVISFQTTTKNVLKETIRTSATHNEAVESLKFARENSLSTGTELIFGLPGESLDTWKEVIDNTLSYGFDSVSMNPLWLLKGSDLNNKKSREDNEYIGKFMLAENAVTSHGDLLSIERDEIAVGSKNFTFEDWKIFLKYQINVLMLSYFGYGKELIYYANNCANIKPTELFDHILENPSLYPVSNELVETYVNSYTANMFDSEADLYGFIKENLETFKKDKESLVRLGKARGLYGYIVKYMLQDPDKKYLREFKDAIVNLSGDEKVKNDANFLLDLSISMMIDPFKEFVPNIKVSSPYDMYSWAVDGYLKSLEHYRYDDEQVITLRCRNPVTVSETIRKDKENNRTDCFHFFRYMNSGLMRRYIGSEESDSSVPWEAFRREHRTTGTHPKN
jgi:radical SAM superfamily enzyme YgiQ (UPF0313 family)